MMGLPPRDRTTDRIVAHSWDDTVVGVVPPCLPRPRAYPVPVPTPSPCLPRPRAYPVPVPTLYGFWGNHGGIAPTRSSIVQRGSGDNP